MLHLKISIFLVFFNALRAVNPCNTFSNLTLNVKWFLLLCSKLFLFQQCLIQKMFSIKVSHGAIMILEQPFISHTLPLLRFGQMIGLCPFPIRHWNAYQESGRWSIYLAISLSCFLLNFFHLLHSILYWKFWMYKISVLITFTSVFSPAILRLQTFILLVESYTKRKHQIDIINSMNFLNSILKKEFKIKNKSNELNRIFWIIIFAVIIDQFVWFALIYIKPDASSRYYNILFYVPYIFRNYQSKLYLVYVYNLTYNIHLINDQLRIIRSDSLFGTDEDHFRAQLNIFKKCYSKIWKISKLIEDWIFWSFTLGFLIDVIMFASSSFWIFMWFFEFGRFSVVQLASALMLLFFSLQIFVICDAFSRAKRAVIESFFFFFCNDRRKIMKTFVLG